MDTVEAYVKLSQSHHSLLFWFGTSTLPWSCQIALFGVGSWNCLCGADNTAHRGIFDRLFSSFQLNEAWENVGCC